MTAERFGQSPAWAYLRVRDPVMATMLDEALALRLIADDASRAARAGGRHGIDDDQRYSVEADYAADAGVA